MSTAMRRSSRAGRTSQAPSNSRTGNSGSNSSNSSIKDERIQRSMTRQESNLKSATPRSVSRSESPIADSEWHDNRRTRQQTRDKGRTPNGDNAAVDDEDEGDDEVTRCVCGQTDYPGPPVHTDTATRNARASAATKSSGTGEQPGDMYIQCDVCKVWQHGGCVGIMTNEMAPQEYFCELCRPSEHRLGVGAKDQRFSTYLPVTSEWRSTKARRPSTTSKQRPPPARGNSKDEDAKLAALAGGKRRSTMNSRVAWEEEQQLLKALEASRGGDLGKTRSNKRSHEDSEESGSDPKRRKTESDSASPAIEEDQDDIESDDDRSTRNSSGKKPRSSAAQSAREAELRRKAQEREREKTEAANKRKERAGRRRTEDSPPPPPLASQASVDSKITSAQRNAKGRIASSSHGRNGSASTPPGPSLSGKKGSRPPPRKGRSGRLNARDSERTGSPEGSDEDTTGGTEGQSSSNGIKSAKSKISNPKKVTINELRRRAAAMSEFITRTQVEMAGSKTPPEEKTSSPVIPAKSLLGKNGMGINGGSKLSREIRGDDEDDTDNAHPESKADLVARANTNGIVKVEDEEAVTEDAFKTLDTLRMMDVIERKLIVFQREYGKLGER